MRSQARTDLLARTKDGQPISAIETGKIADLRMNARVTQSVSWIDTNGDRIPQVDELGEFLGFPSGLFPKVASDATRPYSDEFNAGITQSLASNLAVSVSYHRRQHRSGAQERQHGEALQRQRVAVDPLTQFTQVRTELGQLLG